MTNNRIDLQQPREIVERIKYLIRESRVPQYKFADRIGMNACNLSKHLGGKLPISDILLNKIVVNTGVSKRWLKTGEDTPYGKEKLPSVIVSNDDIFKTPARKGTPIYDIDVTAGPDSCAMAFANDNIVGSIELPGIPEDGLIVKVSGDSMQPIINNGDLVALKKVNNTDLIYWGQIYVLLLDDYRMVKFVRKHKDKSMVILRSENPDYDDIEVKRSDIRDMMIVTNIIHVDTRM